jgi:hypothetical protein
VKGGVRAFGVLSCWGGKSSGNFWSENFRNRANEGRFIFCTP